jgi:hypothetical protein
MLTNMTSTNENTHKTCCYGDCVAEALLNSFYCAAHHPTQRELTESKYISQKQEKENMKVRKFEYNMNNTDADTDVDTDTSVQSPQLRSAENNSQMEMWDGQQWTTVDLECPKCNSNDNVYCSDDNETCYCVRCGVEFNGFDALDATYQVTTRPSLAELEADAAKKAADAILDGNPQGAIEAEAELIARQDAYKGKQLTTDELVSKGKELIASTSSKTTSSKPWEKWVSKSCVHSPRHIIAGDGWGVWAGKKDDVKAHLSQFDVVLNLAGYGPIKQNHVLPIPELQEYESWDSFIELQLDWPDFGIVTLPRSFWEKLVRYLATNRLKCLVFCQGGHGRTGTAIACMQVCALGWTAEKAVTWIRTNYCASAIETTEQRLYIQAIEVQGRAKYKTAEAEQENK